MTVNSCAERYIQTTHLYGSALGLAENELATHIWNLTSSSQKVTLPVVLRRSFELDRERAASGESSWMSFSTREMDAKLPLEELFSLGALRDIHQLAPEVWEHLVKEGSAIRTFDARAILPNRRFKDMAAVYVSVAKLDIPILRLKQ